VDEVMAIITKAKLKWLLSKEQPNHGKDARKR